MTGGPYRQNLPLVIAIDGKTVRGAKTRNGKAPRLVAAVQLSVVTWTDFRDFTDVYNGPAAQASPKAASRCRFPILYSTPASTGPRSSGQPLTSPGRRPTGRPLAFCGSSWNSSAASWAGSAGCPTASGRTTGQPVRCLAHRHWPQQQIRVRLTARDGTPADCARLMADSLVHTQPRHWPVTQRQSLIAADSAT
jgi:hypothetical protein